MTSHHQTDEVLAALAQHQLVVVIGSRGTGKSCLLEDIGQTLSGRGVAVVKLDAQAAQTANALVAPIAVALGCVEDRLTATAMKDNARLRVLVDNCDALHEKTWFPAVQDEWRGLLGEPAARGRVAFLLCGRPLFRRIAEGRGSPLVGIGTFLPTRPLAVEEVESYLATDRSLAEKVRAKTGGHPQLTRRLLDALDRDVRNLERRYVSFAGSQRRFLLQLIDDHGSAARGVIADILNTPRGLSVAESAVLARHYGGAGLIGHDAIDDFAASGLIERTRGRCQLAAEILRTDRDLHQHLRAPIFSMMSDPSEEFVEVATHLFRIENQLRTFVGEALAQVDDVWWPSRFSPAIVSEADQRRRIEEQSPAPPTTEAHPIAYLSFGELLDAMQEEANWEQVFRVRLGTTREAFAEVARAITAVRNKVAHNRPVGPQDVDVLRHAANRLLPS